MRLSGHGISVELPAGWDGRMYKRPEGDPTLHAANFALPLEDGDFATGAASSMGPGGVLIVLTEYDRTLAGLGLFAARGLPVPLRASQVSPRTLLRQMRGQAGLQRFFSLRGRAFCLYVVVGSSLGAAPLLDQVNGVLSSVSVGMLADAVFDEGRGR